MNAINAGPLRRLGAMFYDSLLVIAMLAVVSLLFSLANGHAITAASPWLWWLFRGTLLFVCVGYFVFSWVRTGQTIGMRAWRIYLVSATGQRITRGAAIKRLLCASIPWWPGVLLMALAMQPNGHREWLAIGAWLLVLIPLNYLGAWLDPARRSWHDRWLRSRVVSSPSTN
jgi:uncharacterized RDD family membrane protein YckC